MGKDQHVVPHSGQWAIRGEGNSRVTKVVPTQREAIEIAKGIAQKNHSESVIHRLDGTIREKNSYGSDPFPPKG